MYLILSILPPDYYFSYGTIFNMQRVAIVLAVVFSVFAFSFPFAAFAQAYSPTSPTPEPLPANATDFISNLYQCVLLKQLDPSFTATWLPYWTYYAESSNANIESTFQTFFTTPEYTAKNTSDTQFINQLFDCVLYRPADSAGLSYWVSQLQSKTRSQVIASFLTSQEYMTNIQGRLRSAIANGVAPTNTSSPRMVFAIHMLNVPLTYTAGQSTASLYAEDIKNAKAEGLDGFIMDVFPGTESLVGTMMDTAQANDPTFKLYLEIDEGVDMPASEIIDMVKTYADRPNYLHQNGKPVLTVWDAGKRGHDASWWASQVLAPLAAAGYPVYFIPFFDLPDPNSYAPTVANYDQYVYGNYGRITDGMYDWFIPKSLPFSTSQIAQLPNASWSLTDGLQNFASVMKSHGKAYMASVTPYYWADCHSVRQYYEYEGGIGLDNQWLSIINQQQPMWVAEATWNDYTESTYFSPSENVPQDVAGIPNYPHTGYFELNKYYIAWYKSGAQPPITRDALFYFYRPQSKSATPAHDSNYCSISPISPQYLIGDIQDDLYVTTMLTAPATLKVTSGGVQKTYNVPAGIVHTDLPFSTDAQTFELWRNGVRIAETQGTNILSDPQTYDFNNTSGFAYADDNAASACTPNWSCADWGQCTVSGSQNRVCTDLNACGTATGKPSLNQACTYAGGGSSGSGTGGRDQSGGSGSANSVGNSGTSTSVASNNSQSTAATGNVGTSASVTSGSAGDTGSTGNLGSLTSTTSSPAVDALKAQIASLLLELASLQHKTAPTTSTSCPVISRTLAQGTRGADVNALQAYLISQGLLSSDSVSGYFGQLTQSALKRWQQIHGIVSSGTPATTGWGTVGPRTRKAIASCASA